MNNNIINVYFDANGLPFKDKERTVHYPILGSGLFIGSSRITKIHFFVEQMSDNNAIWIAETKLPNNKHGSQLLTDFEGEEGVCKEMDITGFYTQVKGDVYISLKGYQGGTEASFDTDNQMWVVEGVPISQSTGSVKLSINYAPTGPYPNYNDEIVTYQQILAALGDKANAIGELPHFNVNGTDSVLAFAQTHNKEAVVIKYLNVNFIGSFNITFGNYALFELESMYGNIRYSTNEFDAIDLTNLTFADIFSNTYMHNYELVGNKVTSITSSSTNTQYPSAKGVYDLAQTKQDTLHSGTNIKTINGESLLGSGNIVVGGGSGSAEWGSIGGDIADQSDLQNELQDIREVAEGKTKSYVLSYQQQAPLSDVSNFRKQDGSSFEDIDDFTYYVGELELANPIFNSQNDYVGTDDSYLIVQGKEYGEYIVMIDLSVFNKGDVILVTELDVPDRWVDVQGFPESPNSISASKLETSKIDLDNYATKSELSTEVNKVAHDIAVEYNENTLYGVGDLCIHKKLLYKCNTDNTTGTWDSSKWDLTIVNSELGIIKSDIQHIANGTLNVINASDIFESGTTLKQTYYDIIINGKPTLIVGTVRYSGTDYKNMIIEPLSASYDGAYWGEIFATNNQTNYRYQIRIVVNTKAFQIYQTGFEIQQRTAKVIIKSTRFIDINATEALGIQGKKFPAYPSNTGSFVNKMINGTWSWENEIPTSVSLTDGGTISDTTLQGLIARHQPIVLNGFTCYFSCDDGTNYQYVSTRYDSSANKNHINVITIDKSTWVATFHTSDLAV